MKIRITAVLLTAAMLFGLTACAGSGGEDGGNDGEKKTRTTVQYEEEFKAVWVTYRELQTLYQANSTESEFKKAAKEMFSEIAAFGLNTVIVHARAFSDAFYKSDLFPWSSYLTGEQGGDPGFDPYAILVEAAHAEKLSFHAWINPYRVSLETDFEKLSADNPAKVYYDAAEGEHIIVCERGIYYNPASDEAQKLIINGIRELLQNYAVDAIHFDDYFYPLAVETIDNTSYQDYVASGGTLNRTEWRIQNVNTLVSGVYRAIKSMNEDVLFGISPQSRIEENRLQLFADIKEWAAYAGYVDYLLPQIYYGFNNAKRPFKEECDLWSALNTHAELKVYCGLPVYKSGGTDQFASDDQESADSPYFEFQNYDDIIAREIEYVASLSGFQGIALYSYSSLFGDGRNETMQRETENIKQVLQK